MSNTHQPDPALIARLVETDELLRYVVEELGGQITAIRDFQNSPAAGAGHLERRKATL